MPRFNAFCSSHPTVMERPMRTVAVSSRKGGTGKTTVSVSLAVAAHLRGYKVLLADIDPQYSSLQAVKSRTSPGPAVLASSGGKLFALKAAAVREGIDLLIIDTPSALDSNVLQALHLADLCLLVTRPNYLDLAATLATATASRNLSKDALVVLNQTPPKRGDQECPVVRNAREALRFVRYPVARSALSTRSVYDRATSQGLSVEEAEPGEAAARELDSLWCEVADAAQLLAYHPRASLS
jgi:chromosome partitioning protein